MAQIIELPDGTELEFPEDFSDEQIRSAISANFPQFAPKAPAAPVAKDAPQPAPQPKTGSPFRAGRGGAAVRPPERTSKATLLDGEVPPEVAAAAAAVPPAQREAIRNRVAGPVTAGPRPVRGPEPMAMPYKPDNLLQSALNKTLRKPMDESLGGALLETAGDVARGVSRAPLTAASGLWGLTEAGATLVGADGVADFANRQATDRAMAADQYGNRVDPNPVFQGAAESLTQAAVGRITGLVAVASGNEYNASIARGLKPNEALERASVIGLTEAIGERFGTPQLANLLRKSGASSAIDFRNALVDLVAKDIGGELGTYTMQSAYEKYADLGMQKGMTAEQFVDGAIGTVQASLAMSTLAGGTAAIGRAGRVGSPARLAAEEIDAAQPQFGATAPTTDSGNILMAAANGTQPQPPRAAARAPVVEAQPTTVITPEEILSAPLPQQDQAGAAPAAGAGDSRPAPAAPTIDTNDPQSVLAALRGFGGAADPAVPGRSGRGGAAAAGPAGDPVVPAGGLGDGQPAAGAPAQGATAAPAPLASGAGQPAVGSSNGQAPGSGATNVPSGLSRSAEPAVPAVAIGPESNARLVAGANLAFAEGNQRLAANGQGPGVTPDLTPASDQEVLALAPVANAVAEVLGQGPIAIAESATLGDGVNWVGRTVVNLRGLQKPAPFVVAHEQIHSLQNLAEQGAAASAAGRKPTQDQADAMRIWAPMEAAIWSGVSAESQTKYATTALAVTLKEAGVDTADAAAVAKWVQSQSGQRTLRREMLADFGAKRLTDRAEIEALAKREPALFGDFARKMIDGLTKIIGRLKGGKSGLGANDVDKHIQDLTRAKLMWQDALVSWKKRGGATAAAAVANDATPSASGRGAPRQATEEEVEQLQESGRSPPNRLEAEKYLMDGWRVFVAHDMDDGEAPTQVFRTKDLQAFTPDQVIVLPPEEPSFSGRNEGESDKAFAKRVVDKRERPASLPDRPSDYFNTDGAQMVKVGDLITTKAGDKGGENGIKRMAAAAAGELSKRDPIEVMESPGKPGKFVVVDGNGTVESARSLGWDSLPVRVVTAAQAETKAKREAKIKEAVDAALEHVPEYAVRDAEAEVRKHEGAPEMAVPDADRARLEALIAPLVDQAKALQIGFKAEVEALSERLRAKPKVPGVKGLKRAAEKMYQEERLEGESFKPDWLKDLVRGTIVVEAMEDVGPAIEAVREAFKVIRVKDRFENPTPSGYRDVLINVDLDGMPAELQIHIPEMLAAKELGHLLYEVERDLPDGDAKKKGLQEAQTKFYGAAYDAATGAEPLARLASSSSNAEREMTSSSSSFSNTTSVTADLGDSPGRRKTGNASLAKNKVPSGNDFKSTTETSDPGTSPDPSIVNLGSQLGQAAISAELKLAAAKHKAGRRNADEIAQIVGLTPEERASTVLDLMTGKPGSEAFVSAKVGGIPPVVSFLEERRQASGLRQLSIENEADREVLAKMMAAETLGAIRGAGNALEWYDSTIRRTLGAMALKYPQLRSDPYAQNAFLASMAITSQGLNVEDNLKVASRQFDAWVRDGVFPEEGSGDSAAVMAKNFRLYNALRSELGDQGLYRFLRTQFTVKELNSAGFEVGGELADEMVLGSSVFGPKIGFGFFSNLAGNFEPVTMDMWFMRTIGRLTGSLRAFDEGKFSKQLARLRGSLDERGDNGIFADLFDEGLVERARTDTDAAVELARKVAKRHEKDFKDRRGEYDSKARVKSDLVNSAQTIIQSMDKPRDVPSSGGERRLLRDVVRRAVDMVATHNGQRVPPAAMQALIWYPEQELYKALGVKLRVTSQDYAGAAEKVLKEQGYEQQAIRESAQRGPGGARPADVGQVAAGDRPAGQEPGELGPLEGSERRDFVHARAIGELRRSGGGLVYGEGRGAGPSARLDVAGTRVKPTAEYRLGRSTKNTLEAVGISTPTIYEIPSANAADFARAIEGSKVGSRFASSVYVYPVDEYAGMRLFVAAGGKAGFALKGDDIVSVFNYDPANKGAVHAMLPLAIEQGGRRLDAFDTVLPSLYGMHGFKARARLPWNEDFAPEGWDKAAYSKYNGGEPDVVFMAHEPDNFAQYRQGDGPVAEGYDAAVAAQQGEAPSFSRRSPVSPASVLEQAITSGASSLSAAVRSGGRVGAQMGRTPHVLNMLGAPVLQMVIDPSIVRKVFLEKHATEMAGVSPEELVRGLYRPAMIFKNPASPNEYELVTSVATPTGPITAAIVVDQDRRQAAIKSIYPRSWKVKHEGKSPTLQDFVEGKRVASKIVYYDEFQAPMAVTGNTAFRTAEDRASARPGTPLNTKHYRSFKDFEIANRSSRRGAKTEDDLLAWIGDNYTGDMADAPSFSQRQPTLFRDELGRLRAPTGKLAAYYGGILNTWLAKVGLNYMSPELKRQFRAMKIQLQKAQDVTMAVAEETFKMSQAERELVSDIVEGELKTGIVPPQHAVQMAMGMQAVLEQQTNELVSLGMLSQDSADMWRGKYLPRFYKPKLADTLTAWGKVIKELTGRKPIMSGIQGKRLKGRGLWETVRFNDLADWEALGWQVRDPEFDRDIARPYSEVQVWRDFTPEERQNMGEIRDAGFRFAMGYQQAQRDIAFGRLFQGIASTMASAKERPGFVQVPDGTVEGTGVKRYGALAGMWVPEEVLQHLKAMDSGSSPAMRAYRKAMSLWKEAKTVLNPVSHANNVLSNISMAHFAGVSYWDGHKYLGAIRDLVQNTDMVKEAKEAGLFLGTMNQEELVALLPPELQKLANTQLSATERGAETAWNLLSFWLRRPMAAAYEGEDLFFRFLIYRDARSRGLTPADAVDYSQRYIFTYDDLPITAQRIRDFGLPFFAYTYKVVPALLHTAANYPHRLLAPAAILYGLNAAMYAMAAGDDDEDWLEKLKAYASDKERRERAAAMSEEERANLPPWMKGAVQIGAQKAIRLHTDEVLGLPVFWDVGQIMPGGNLFDLQSNTDGVALPQSITPSHPLFTTMSAMLINKDMFLGKEIVDKNDTSGEAAAKRAEWMWRQFTPAIAFGNYHWERGLNVLAQQTGEPVRYWPWRELTGVDKQGMPVTPGYAALQTVGIKVRPVDIERSMEMAKGQREALIRDIDKELRNFRRQNQAGYMSDEILDREIEKANLKKERLREGLTVDGEVPK